MAMVFETKIAVVVRNDLPVWQRVNMTAFLVSGIAAMEPETVGEPYEDGGGNRYLPMFRQPVLVFEADAAKLRTIFERAKRRDVAFAIFTDDLFATGHDADNRAAVKAVPKADLSLAGLAFRADRKIVDKIVDGVPFHR